MMIKPTILALSFTLTFFSVSVSAAPSRHSCAARALKPSRPTIPRNNWKKPCFGGECSYDSTKGSVKLWGSPAAIADITEAGGWDILNCNSTLINQDIRLVCTKPEGCDKLFNTIDPTRRVRVSPVGKLVRLPESCGRGAFARVARVWEHSNQRIPENVRQRIVRRDGETADPIVRGMTLDTDFAKIDPATTGQVFISFQGTNVPGLANATEATVSTREVDERGFFDFIENAFNKFNHYNHNTTTKLPPLDIEKQFTLVDASIDCPAIGNIPAMKAAIRADVDAKAHAVVSIGLAAEGTIIPPKINTFGVFAGLDADFRGTLDLTGSASGTIDTGKITFFQQAIPGLDFPGLLTLGPSFKLQGQAMASLDVGVDMQIDLAYSVKDAKLFFPKSAQPSGGGFTSSESPLHLRVSPSIKAKGTIEAHLIPVLDLGISALGGLAKATIFLNLDASADLTLTLEAEASADVTIPIGDDPVGGDVVANNNGTAVAVKDATVVAVKNASADTMKNATMVAVKNAAAVAVKNAAAVAVKNGAGLAVKNGTAVPAKVGTAITAGIRTALAAKNAAVVKTISTAEKTPVETVTSAHIKGCVRIGGGLDVNAGADASFFGLFDKSTSVSLFSKDFEFFKKCIDQVTAPNNPGPPPRRRAFIEAARQTSNLSKRIDITCPTTADFTNLMTIADEKLIGQTRRSLPRAM